MNFSSIFSSYYNWYRNFIFLFLFIFLSFFTYVIFSTTKNTNDEYTDYLIEKYAYNASNLKRPSKDSVDAGLLDLNMILSVNDIKDKMEAIYFIENNIFKKKSNKVVRDYAELVYCYILISNNLNGTFLENIFYDLTEDHIYVLDMHFLKAVYFMRSNNLYEAEKVLNLLMFIKKNNSHRYATIDQDLIDSFQYHIKRNKK